MVTMRMWALGLTMAVSGLTPLLACAQDTAQKNGTKPAERTPDVIFVPTPMVVVDEMLSVTKVGKNDILFDLGSGDGRIVITAAKRFGTKGIGIDIDPQRIKESLANADTAGVSKMVEFRQADLFKTDLSSATVVTLYLLPRLNVQLRPKLFTELRPGTRIVSHAFDMADWKADSTMSPDNRTVFYWLLPANVAGTWTLTYGKQTATLKLTQRFQVVSGSATVDGKEVTLNDLTVQGDRFRFAFVDAQGKTMRFEGTVNGGTITGHADQSGGQSWSATRAETTPPAIAD